MHHPGPPRFASVGDEVDLSPRDPDPAATYRWHVERAPEGSTATVPDDPVVSFSPDVPGRYVLVLRAPDGEHRLTVRCFGGPPRSEPRHVGRSGPGGESGGVFDATGDDGDGSYRERSPTGEREVEGGRPRVRLDGHLEADVAVIEADPRAHPHGTETAADLDVEFVLDDRDDLSASAISVEGRTLRVPIDALGELARVHAVAAGDHGHSVADALAIRREPGSGDIEFDRLYEPPAWATDAVYYEVYVRTFAPEADHGATFDAIGDRLDHLADLGVDVLWLTPVLENDDAPHGYNITDFLSIAADLGDRADYRRLVQRARERGMKVLFDLVLNHSARAHPYFRDAYGNPESDYRDWYEWQEDGEPGTYFDWEHIANFDFSSLEVRRHLLDVVDTWAPLVDGFRCDMAWAVPNGFWRELRDRVKARDPEFLLLDETIPYIPDFQEGMFDVHFDSTTYATLRSVGTGWAPADALLEAIEERRTVGFPEHAGFLLYAENHDETRYLVEADRPAALAAAGALCTLPGAPLVYAGQELGQLGRRDDVVWEGTDEALTDHYRRLLHLRRDAPALAADADLHRVPYDVRSGEADRVVAFGRVAADTDGAESLDDLGDRIAREGAASGTTAAVVLCHFGEGEAVVEVDPSFVPVDVVTGGTLDPGNAVSVDDVVVLPTVPDVFGGSS